MVYRTTCAHANNHMLQRITCCKESPHTATLRLKKSLVLNRHSTSGSDCPFFPSFSSLVPISLLMPCTTLAPSLSGAAPSTVCIVPPPSALSTLLFSCTRDAGRCALSVCVVEGASPPLMVIGAPITGAAGLARVVVFCSRCLGFGSPDSLANASSRAPSFASHILCHRGERERCLWIYIYIYIYICVCVYMCRCKCIWRENTCLNWVASFHQHIHHEMHTQKQTYVTAIEQYIAIHTQYPNTYLDHLP